MRAREVTVIQIEMDLTEINLLAEFLIENRTRAFGETQANVVNDLINAMEPMRVESQIARKASSEKPNNRRV